MFMVVGVFASPITVSDVKVNNVNGEYVVLVSLNNADVNSGVYTDLQFKINELGTTKDVGIVKVDSNDTVVLTYKLKDVTDNYDLLKDGQAYTLTVSTDDSSKETSFLFGSYKDTDGLDLVLDNVKINGEDVDGDVLSVMNGEQLKITLRFTAQNNFDDARIMAFLEGYEHSPIVATTDVFGVVAGKTYFKTLTLNLPADMDSEKDYKLRIVGANDLSGITYKDYTIYVDTQRHRVDVLDLITTPASGVEPGQNVIANVRMKNRGQKEEDSVKVTVSIPALGIAESSYVSNLNKDEVATSDDMLLYIPESAKPGVYEVDVVLSYDDGYQSTVSKYQMNVLAPKTTQEKNLIVNYKNNVNLKAGQTTEFNVVVANPNSDSKPVSIVPIENSWADVEVTPSLAMVQGGSDATFTVKVTPKAGISGEKTLSLSIKEGSTVVSNLDVSAYVANDNANSINWVQVALVVLLIIAIIVLLSLVVTIAKRKKESDVDSTEEYY